MKCGTFYLWCLQKPSDPMNLTRSMQRFFKVIAHVYLDIRKDPDVNAERTGESLVFGAFLVRKMKRWNSRSLGGGFKWPILGGFWGLIQLDQWLVGWFLGLLVRWLVSNFFYFTPKIGEDEPILTHIFEMGWNHQLVQCLKSCCCGVGCMLDISRQECNIGGERFLINPQTLDNQHGTQNMEGWRMSFLFKGVQNQVPC